MLERLFQQISKRFSTDDVSFQPCLARQYVFGCYYDKRHGHESHDTIRLSNKSSTFCLDRDWAVIEDSVGCIFTNIQQTCGVKMTCPRHFDTTCLLETHLIDILCQHICPKISHTIFKISALSQSTGCSLIGESCNVVIANSCNRLLILLIIEIYNQLNFHVSFCLHVTLVHDIEFRIHHNSFADVTQISKFLSFINFTSYHHSKRTLNDKSRQVTNSLLLSDYESGNERFSIGHNCTCEKDTYSNVNGWRTRKSNFLKSFLYFSVLIYLLFSKNIHKNFKKNLAIFIPSTLSINVLSQENLFIYKEQKS